MPTVYWPEDGDDAEEWPLCRDCYEAVKGEVLIVPGQGYAWGWCGSCQGWHSLNDMKEWAGGGPRGAPQGSCVACAGMPG
jgi:hypothetical protein